MKFMIGAVGDAVNLEHVDFFRVLNDTEVYAYVGDRSILLGDLATKYDADDFLMQLVSDLNNSEGKD